MLRLASSGISDSLTKLFNECIRKGEWPEAWKKGEWNPVHKKDDRLDERNYRPITLLSTVDNVFESMMSIQVYNDNNATYEELLEKGRLSSLENRRLQDILILMYKVKNSLAPEHVCNMFFQQDRHYNLRSDFPVPRHNTVKYGKNSIRYLGPHIWGKISQELRSKTSLQAFRKGVRALDVLGLLDGTCGCCACTS